MGFNHECVLYSTVWSSDDELIVNSFGSKSICNYVNVIAAMALCTFPFLCILVITEYLIEPGMKAGMLSRRLIIIFNSLFTLLTLVLACLCTSGFNELCGSMAKTGADDCNRRINFKIIEYPCELLQDCGVVYDISAPFHTALTATKSLSWLLFASIVALNGVNFIHHNARATNVQFQRQHTSMNNDGFNEEDKKVDVERPADLRDEPDEKTHSASIKENREEAVATPAVDESAIESLKTDSPSDKTLSSSEA